MSNERALSWHEPPLSEVDPDIDALIREEERREADTLRIIASENYVSRAVLEASGSILTNKYSEGYAGKRYYEGQQSIDPIEEIACRRLKELFRMDHVNVQPYSGSPANLAVYLATLSPGDTVMGLGLASGGHLTHGHSVSITGRWFKSIPYGLRASDARIDMDQVRSLAREHKPKLIFCGISAYPRELDFKAFADVAKEVGAVLAADIAHIAGLVVAGVHPSPAGIADVVTTTTHKTFRGPRGGVVMCRQELAASIDKAVFPGLQGGPHNHTTAGIAVAAREASLPAFRAYAQQTVDNAKVLAEELLSRGFRLVTGGTDNHLILVDLTNKNVTGKVAAKTLDRAGIVANYNAIPNDPRKPFDPSGLRMGTPAVTSRGMKTPEMKRLAAFIDQVIAAPGDDTLVARVAGEVKEMCRGFPAPGLRV
jgi:glycine hydroxymethyltransferase